MALRKELAENRCNGLAPTTQEAVEILVQRTRQHGYGLTHDFIPGIGGMAAPVFDHAGEMALALVALGYSRQFEADFERICAAVMRTAAALSERFGSRSPKR